MEFSCVGIRAVGVHIVPTSEGNRRERKTLASGLTGSARTPEASGACRSPALVAVAKPR